jgi:fatty acid desaturase
MSLPAIPDPKQQVLPAAENLFKALLLIALLFVLFYCADRLAAALDAVTTMPAGAAMVLKWGLIALLAVVNGVLITGMGVLAHDAVHRVLFRSRFWNEFWGGVLSALALIPFYANRQCHLTHHAYAHQPGLDPENAMHHHSFYYAATVGSVIALKEQYRLFFTNLLHVGDRRYTGRILKDSGFMGFAAAVYFGLVPALGISLVVTVVPVILLFPVVFAFRAMSDHYGIPPLVREIKKREDILDADEETWHADGERRQREVSGWVVLTAPWLEWLWSHVNYHEVHHKYPYLSHRYLPQVFAATRARYPYLVVRGYGRSLLNLRKRRYYSTPQDVRPYRTDFNAALGKVHRAD